MAASDDSEKPRSKKGKLPSKLNGKPKSLFGSLGSTLRGILMPSLHRESSRPSTKAGQKQDREEERAQAMKSVVINIGEEPDIEKPDSIFTAITEGIKVETFLGGIGSTLTEFLAPSSCDEFSCPSTSAAQNDDDNEEKRQETELTLDLCLREIDLCQQKEIDLCRQKEVDVCQQKEVDVCQQKEMEVCRQKEVDVCQQNEIDVCQQNEIDLCQQKEIDMCQQKEIDLCHHKEEDLSYETEMEVCRQHEIEVRHQKEVEVCHSDDGSTGDPVDGPQFQRPSNFTETNITTDPVDDGPLDQGPSSNLAVINIGPWVQGPSSSLAETSIHGDPVDAPRVQGPSSSLAKTNVTGDPVDGPWVHGPPSRNLAETNVTDVDGSQFQGLPSNLAEINVTDDPVDGPWVHGPSSNLAETNVRATGEEGFKVEVDFLDLVHIAQSFSAKASQTSSRLCSPAVGVRRGSVSRPPLFTLYSTPLSSFDKTPATSHDLYTDDIKLFVSFAPNGLTDSMNIDHLRAAAKYCSW